MMASEASDSAEMVVPSVHYQESSPSKNNNPHQIPDMTLDFLKPSCGPSTDSVRATAPLENGDVERDAKDLGSERD
jgi:hypothetical protein